MEWISVKQELPVENVHVLCCTCRGQITISSLQRLGWAGNCDVAYWMPLPSVPKPLKEKLRNEIGYIIRERNPIKREVNNE